MSLRHKIILILAKSISPILLAVLLFLAYPALAQQPSMRLYVIGTGLVKTNFSHLVQGAPQEAVEVPISAYLISHPKGWILFDTGLGSAWGRFFDRLPAKIKKHLPLKGSYQDSVVKQISRIGLKPKDIKYVILSHLHYDHAGDLSAFEGAKIIVSKKEWGHDRKNIFVLLSHGYLPWLYRSFASRVRYIDYDKVGRRHSVFGKTVDLFGDESVVIVETPGHSAGHQSLLVNFGGGKKVFLLGDAAAAVEGIEKVAPRGKGLRWVEYNSKMQINTLKLLRLFMKTNPKVLMVPNHDPHTWQRLKKLPEFYTVENF